MHPIFFIEQFKTPQVLPGKTSKKFKYPLVVTCGPISPKTLTPSII